MWIGPGLMNGVRGTFWAEEEMYKGLSFVVSSQRTMSTLSGWNRGYVYSINTFSAMPWPSIMGNLEKKCMRPRP